MECFTITSKRHSGVFLLSTLNIFHTLSSISIVDFEQVNLSWKILKFALWVAGWLLAIKSKYFRNYLEIS